MKNNIEGTKLSSNLDNEPTASETLQTKDERVSKTFTSLRHRNFQLYFGGQLVSVSGTWMQLIALGWLVYQLSHSDFTLGLVGFAAAIPSLIVAPWGGVIADRVSKRGLLVMTNSAAMVLAFVLSVLAFINQVQVWHIILLSVLLGVVNALDGPTRQAFVVDMVGREDLTNAIAMNSVMINGARVIGPAFGGVMMATVGPSWCFFINGLSFLAVIIGLVAMKLQKQPAPELLDSPWKQLTAGLKYVQTHVDLFALLLLATIFSVFGTSYTSILPAYVDQVLKMNADGYGALNAAIGFGAVTGAFFIARLGDNGGRGKILTVASFAFPILLGIFAGEGNFYLSLTLAYFLGIFFMFQFNLINTLLQIHVDHAMRGRVLALYTLTFSGFAPFGNLAVGNLAGYWGLTAAIRVSALTALVLAAIVLVLVPQVRKYL
jgi:MFS family permease